MDMTVFIPREFHSALAILGRHPWLGSTTTETGDRRRALNAASLLAVENRLSSKDKALLRMLLSQPKQWDAVAAVAKALADGPKCFRPTFVQCEAMQHVSVDITLADYRQAFPVVIIELPDEYVRTYNAVSKYVLVHHDYAERRCFLLNGSLMDNPVYSTGMSSENEMIEQKLVRIESDDFPEMGLEGFDRAVMAERIALNCNLVLTQYRLRARDFDPKYAAKLRKNAKSTNRDRSSRARVFLSGQFTVLEFEQEVAFHAEEYEPSSPSTNPPAGGHKRPHWRRGHWRRQAFGPGWAEHRLQFIRPAMIRGDLFVGEASDTSVTYSARNIPA